MFKQDSTNRVGSNATPAAKPTPKPSPKATGNFNADGLKSAVEGKIPGYSVGGNAGKQGYGLNLVGSLSNAEKTAIAQLLKKLGHSVKSIKDLNATLSTYYSDEYNGSMSYSQLYSALAADLIPGMSQDTTATAAIPSRQISNYSDAQLEAFGKSIFQSKIGRMPSKDELAEEVNRFKKQIAEGTVTTTKKVYNKKLKRYENVTEVTPGFSQERATIETEERLKTQYADEYKLNKALAFKEDLNRILGGGM